MEYRKQAVLSLRVFQLICAAFVITGFVWATSDLLLTTILAEAPVTPLSVLMMFYGLIGTFSCEATVRLLNRQVTEEK